MLCRVVARLPKALHTSQRCNTALACRPYWAIPHPNYLKPSIGTETTTIRPASSSASSTRWKERQARDSFSREAKVAGLKSRAAFKLLEINEKYHIFRRGDTVVDLGYAPGSWSQVAVNRTQPGGKVVGIDIIPAQPPRGVSTLQGDFLSPAIREELVKYVRETGRTNSRAGSRNDDEEGWTEEQFGEEGKGMIQKRLESGPVATLKRKDSVIDAFGNLDEGLTKKQKDVEEGRVVNVVLSDMSEPWPQTSSSWIRSVSNPYRRMMNASGMAFRDHAGSMVCLATSRLDIRPS